MSITALAYVYIGNISTRNTSPGITLSTESMATIISPCGRTEIHRITAIARVVS